MAAGAAAGLGVLVTGGHMTFGQGLEAGVNVLPIEFLFIGAGVFFFAFAPRLGVGFLYALVVVAFVWDLFGALLGFPDWLLAVSPYRHVAPAPAKPIAVVAALLMIAIGAGATMAGVARFRRRDLAGD
jgi:ABC-2 type transport system permease protein